MGVSRLCFFPERDSGAQQTVVKPRELSLLALTHPPERDDLVSIPCSSDLLASLLLDPGPTDLTRQQFGPNERNAPMHSSSAGGVRFAGRHSSRQTSALAVGSGTLP